MKKRFAGALLWLTAASLVFASSYKMDDVMISAEEAKKLIGKKGVVFVSGDADDIYSLGHIKGSVEMYAHHLHHAEIDGHMHCAPLFMCPDEAEKYIGSKGITNDDLIIAYDDFRGPNATGVYVFFKSWGHKNVKILDGGRSAMMSVDPAQKEFEETQKEIAKLKGEKAPKEKISQAEKKAAALEKKLLVLKGVEGKITPKKYKIDPKKIDYELIASKEDVKTAMEDIIKNGEKSNFVIIDSRGFNEVFGDKKLDNVARGGHVPGAIFMEWKNFSDFDKRLSFKKLDEMQKVFDKYGITKDKKIITYCHVGAGRSTHIMAALKMLGYEDVKVYTGSWDEWGNDMSLPIRR